MATIKKQPAYVHTAFNPTILELEKEATDESSISVQLFNKGGSEITSLESEFINSVATFDFKKIISKRFVPTRTNRIHSRTGSQYTFVNLYTDNNLVQPYGRVYTDHLTDLHFAINAVSQFGQSHSLLTKRLSFLTHFDKIIKYEGYEYALCFLGNNMKDDEPTYLNVDGIFEDMDDDIPVNLSRLEDDQIECPHFTLALNGTAWVDLSNSPNDYYLRNNDGQIICDNYGIPITIQEIPDGYQRKAIAIEMRPAPETGFYVRWINQLGGWDAWMFGCRQYFTKSLTGTQTYNPYFVDVETITGNVQVYQKTGKEQVKVSSGMVTKNQYDTISALIYSPRIEWFNKETNTWITIIVDKGDNEIGGHKPSGECRFTFDLPAPQLQF